jgi:hypothetical protein
VRTDLFPDRHFVGDDPFERDAATNDEGVASGSGSPVHSNAQPVDRRSPAGDDADAFECTNMDRLKNVAR